MIPYALRLWDKAGGKYYATDNLPGGATLQMHIEGYIQSRQADKSVIAERQSVIRTEEPEVSSSVVQGIIKCGDYGYAADLENLDSGDQFQRGINDCEYLPFYYRFEFKNGQDEAIVLLQKFGSRAIKTVLEEDLKTYFEAAVPDAGLSLNPIVSEDYVLKVLGGGIKQLKYIKFYVPADIADDIGMDDHIQEDATMELVIKARRNAFLSIPDWMRTGVGAKSNTIEISGVEYDDVKLQVDIDGRKKTVDLSDLRKFNMSLDISDSVALGSNGHPTYESLKYAAEETVLLIRKAIKWDDIQ